MKSTSALLMLTIACLLTACMPEKKEDPLLPPVVPVPYSCERNTFRFSRDMNNTTDIFYDVMQDDLGFIMALSDAGVYKHDHEGHRKWFKPMSALGTPQNIIRADGGNYFVTSATFSVGSHSSGQYVANRPGAPAALNLTTYYKAIGGGISTLTCKPNYQLTTRSSPDVYSLAPMPVNSSKCRLTKIDADGNVMWAKEFAGNYFDGQSLARGADGNFYLLTHMLSGLFSEGRFDANNIFMDTIDTPYDRNSLILRKIDKEGNVLWQKTYTGIINDNQRAMDESKVWFGARIVVDGSRICMQTERDFILTDLDGNVVVRMKPHGNDCTATGIGLSAIGEVYYSSGTMTEWPGKFVAAYRKDGTIFFNAPQMTDLIGDGETYAIENGFIQQSKSRLGGFEGYGFMKWGHNLTTDHAYCANSTCNGGAIYIIHNFEYKRFLVKVDRNGN